MCESGLGTAPVYATPDVSQPARSQQPRSRGGWGPDAGLRGVGGSGGASVVPQVSLLGPRAGLAVGGERARPGTRSHSVP